MCNWFSIGLKLFVIQKDKQQQKSDFTPNFMYFASIDVMTYDMMA